MSKKPVLVDLEKLKELVAKVNLGDEQLNEYHKLFAQKVEELIRHEITDYIVAVTPKPPAGKATDEGASGARTGG